MTDSQSGKNGARPPRTAARWKEEWEMHRKNPAASPAHGMCDLAEELERELAEANNARDVTSFVNRIVELEKERDALRAARSAERTSELEAANVGLADEAARMRMALSELVDAGSAFDHRDDMDFDEEQAAEKRWLAALDAARPFTEAALLAPSATRPTPPSDAGKDATRYRRVRDDYRNFAIYQNIGHDWTRLEPQEANAAIDAAIAAAPAPAEGER